MANRGKKWQSYRSSPFCRLISSTRYDFDSLPFATCLTDPCQIFSHLPPLCLLYLGRTSKALRQLLMSRNSIGVWRASLEGVNFVPRPEFWPTDEEINLPAWCALIFETVCQARFQSCYSTVSKGLISPTGLCNTQCAERRLFPSCSLLRRMLQETVCPTSSSILNSTLIFSLGYFKQTPFARQLWLTFYRNTLRPERKKAVRPILFPAVRVPHQG